MNRYADSPVKRRYSPRQEQLSPVHEQQSIFPPDSPAKRRVAVASPYTAASPSPRRRFVSPVKTTVRGLRYTPLPYTPLSLSPKEQQRQQPLRPTLPSSPTKHRIKKIPNSPFAPPREKRTFSLGYTKLFLILGAVLLTCLSLLIQDRVYKSIRSDEQIAHEPPELNGLRRTERHRQHERQKAHNERLERSRHARSRGREHAQQQQMVEDESVTPATGHQKKLSYNDEPNKQTKNGIDKPNAKSNEQTKDEQAPAPAPTTVAKVPTTAADRLARAARRRNKTENPPEHLPIPQVQVVKHRHHGETINDLEEKIRHLVAAQQRGIQQGANGALPQNNHANAGRFAYAYLVGGVDPDRPAYQWFLFNILINTKLLRDEGSPADTVVYIQMLHTSKYESLPEEDMKLLNKLNIHVRLILKNEKESFDTIVMEKFRVLELTQYERVLFLDSDVMLLGSLDYLFDLSDRGILKRNVVFAGREVPASGSIFMISPLEGDWDHIQEIIRNKEKRGTSLPYPHFDVDEGWGQGFEGKHSYELLSGKKGSSWDFLGASSDQGILYHFVKYEEKSVSIVMNDIVQNWEADKNGRVHLEKSLNFDIFEDSATKRACWPQYMDSKACVTPHSDYVHFADSKKPWLHKVPQNLSETHSRRTPRHYWYYALSELNKELGMGLDIQSWEGGRAPLLGTYANYIEGIDEAPKESTTHHGKFAYAYVVGGCDPKDPAYRNFIFDILVNTHLMREEGSTADVVLFIQMSFDSAADKLTGYDEITLKQMNVKIHYIPKNEGESIERLMMDKFRILSLTDYDRVLYLDSDIMTRGSLDYLFELSLNGTLKENFAVAGANEPVTGSMFMLSPRDGDWDRVLEIIQDKEKREVGTTEPNQFDAGIGWGQAFKGDDSFVMSDGSEGNTWDFPGALSDKGLLYHWIKYEKKSASILLSDTIEHWGAGKDGKLNREKKNGIDAISSHGIQRECWSGTLRGKPCVAPHSDIIHFKGQTKPWLAGPPSDLTEKTANSTPRHYWFHILSIINKKMSLSLEYKHWKKNYRPLLGFFPAEVEMAGTTYSEPKNVESPYTKNATGPHRYAYAYVIGGVKPEDPSYRNYLNDIMISTYVQREEGSTADIVVFVQMAHESSFEVLADEDIRLLAAMEIQVRYIPKAEDESFYRIMLDKFLILGLTQYDRVIFMDSDVMTRGSLDYLFDLSVQGVLKENVVFAGQTEPANGGFFMLAPKEGATDRIMKIIQDKEERCAKLPYPHWDEAVGWGHEIEEGDYFHLLKEKKETKWNFYGGFADQGLLYHWVKYEEKSVSIIFRNSIQNWGAGSDGKVRLEKTLGLDVFDRLSVEHLCWKGVMKMKPCRAPHSDFIHFTGTSKPWLHGPPEDFGEVPPSTSPKHTWFHVLNILNDKMKIGLDFKNWKTHHRPFLGMFPQHQHAAKTSYAKKASETNR